MTRWLRYVIAAAALMTVGLPAAQATAQEEVESMTFEELLGEAKSAYDAENFDRAIEMLLAANRKQPNARLLLNVGKSYDKMGDCVKAQVYFRAFVRNPEAEQSLVKPTQKDIANADECEGWDDLMAGRLIVTSTPAGATVLVDGNEVGEAPTEVVGLMEGNHVVSVQLEGYETIEKQVDLLPDRDEQLDLTLSEEVEEVVVEPEPEPVPEPEAEPSPPVIQYAIAGGIGAVGLGLFTAGLITDLGIPAKYDEPRMDPDISAEEFDELDEERDAAVTRATIFYISGGVLMAGAAGYATYVAVTSGKEKEKSPMLSFSPAVGRDGFGVVLRGEF